MEQSGGRLTSKQICEIIKAGRDNGVKSVNIHKNGVIIVYNHEPADQIVITHKTPDVNVDLSDELKNLKQEELIEHIKLVDPDQYEQMLADGSIEDVHDE